MQGSEWPVRDFVRFPFLIGLTTSDDGILPLPYYFSYRYTMQYFGLREAFHVFIIIVVHAYIKLCYHVVVDIYFYV